jgi:aspartyl-tRNA(Asn)/glutamyl-tRNA(Gln) amidotransferase subunit C
MKVTPNDVVYVADLANLELTEDERTRMLRDLNSILDYIDRLSQLDTSNVPPMAQVREPGEQRGGTPFEYASREDVLHGLRPSLPRDTALASAPDSDGVFFKVPKVIDR